MTLREKIDDNLLGLQCCIGRLGYSYIRNLEKGLPCEPTSIEYLTRAYSVLQNWYPEEYVIREEVLPYFIYSISPALVNILITDQSGTELYNGLAVLSTIVSGINDSETGYSAENVNGYLWIYAPSAGYNGMSLTVGGAGAASLTALTASFQGGCEGKVAAAPCLSEQEAEAIYEALKRECFQIMTTTVEPLSTPAISSGAAATTRQSGSRPIRISASDFTVGVYTNAVLRGLTAEVDFDVYSAGGSGTLLNLNDGYTFNRFTGALTMSAEDYLILIY